MVKRNSKRELSPEAISALEGMNHEQAGAIADSLGISPQVVWYHIKKRSQSLTKLEWLTEVQNLIKKTTGKTPSLSEILRQEP